MRRAIAKKGIKGVHMFEEALNQNMGEIGAIFKKDGFDITTKLSE